MKKLSPSEMKKLEMYGILAEWFEDDAYLQHILSGLIRFMVDNTLQESLEAEQRRTGTRTVRKWRASRRHSSKRIRVRDIENDRRSVAVVIDSWRRRSVLFKDLAECCKDGTCNFTTIGGIFVLLAIDASAGLGIPEDAMAG